MNASSFSSSVEYFIVVYSLIRLGYLIQSHRVPCGRSSSYANLEGPLWFVLILSHQVPYGRFLAPPLVYRVHYVVHPPLPCR